MNTSRIGDLCHNQQLGRAAGGNSGGRCPWGLVGQAALHAHIELRDTSGWQDCSLQKPAMKTQKRGQAKISCDEP